MAPLAKTRYDALATLLHEARVGSFLFVALGFCRQTRFWRQNSAWRRKAC
jgi:hypothetical protein